MDLKFTIAPEVFAKYPGYVRGVVLAHGVQNGHSPAALLGLLRQAEAGLRARLNIDTLTEDPRIASWREAYRAFGAKPSEFRPSMEAMTRRVLRGQELPAINALVDLGNVVSLRRLLPIGGHAIDQLTSDISLRIAHGGESFVPLGETAEEHPEPGEIVFVEGNIVLTRRWTWRQANHTLMVPGTTAVEINVDGLPPVTVPEVEETCDEVAGLVQRFCGGRTRWEVVSASHPQMSLGE